MGRVAIDKYVTILLVFSNYSKTFENVIKRLEYGLFSCFNVPERVVLPLNNME